MRRAAAATILSALAVACGSNQSTGPISPTPVGAPAAAAAPRLGGFVFEPMAGGGRRPVADARVFGWVDRANGTGYAVQLGITGADGRYQASPAPDGDIRVNADKAGYVQPCMAGGPVQDGSQLDVQLVPREAPRVTPTSPALTGIVFETTASGRQPIIGADVSALWLGEYPVVTTVTDSTGEFVLCNLTRSLIDGIWARKAGYVQYVGPVRLAIGVTTFDVELAQRKEAHLRSSV
jgi:hypothetical protein